MRKSHKDMSIGRLKSSIDNYTILIEHHKVEKPNLSKLYIVKKKNAIKILDEKLKVIYNTDPQEIKSLSRELTDRFKKILTSPYNHELFFNFTEDLRKFTQNKQS